MLCRHRPVPVSRHHRAPHDRTPTGWRCAKCGRRCTHDGVTIDGTTGRVVWDAVVIGVIDACRDVRRWATDWWLPALLFLLLFYVAVTG